MGPRLTGAAVGLGVLGLRASIRIDTLHGERREELRTRGAPFVLAVWHGRMVLPMLTCRHQGIVTMASRSKDGEIIARWLTRNGIHPARGSTRKGGGTALHEMIGLVQAGHSAALTVDGPKGPPRVVQPGILQLARRTGAWILPAAGASTRPWFLRSWDRYLVPKPFSRCVVSYGEPFPAPEGGDDAAILARIGASIDAITREVDAAVGVVPPPPWES